jgi:flagellar motor protein MotB
MKDRRTLTSDVVSVPGGEAWFISFGDLLTLLVCFFLLLTPQAPSNAGTLQTNQQVSANPGVSLNSGTDLASLPLDPTSSVTGVVPIWRDSLVVAGQARERNERSAVWLWELRRSLERGQGVVVKLCDPAVEQEVVSEVAGELTNRIGAVGRVQFEVDPECGLLRERFSSPKELAAVVMISGK